MCRFISAFAFALTVVAAVIVLVPGPVQAQALRQFVGVPGTRFNLEQGMPSDLGERMGPEQRERELVQTTLLNRFGGMGFAEMRNLTKQDDLYHAEVKTVEGIWVNVMIDPQTGAVTVQQ